MTQYTFFERPRKIALNQDGSRAAFWFENGLFCIFKHGEQEAVEIPTDLQRITAMAYLSDNHLLVKVYNQLFIIDIDQKEYKQCWTSCEDESIFINRLFVDPSTHMAAEFVAKSKIAVYDPADIKKEDIVDLGSLPNARIEDFKAGYIICIRAVNLFEDSLFVVDLHGKKPTIREVMRGKRDMLTNHKIWNAVLSADGKHLAVVFSNRIEILSLQTLSQEKVIIMPKANKGNFYPVAIGQESIVVCKEPQSRALLFDMDEKKIKNALAIPRVERDAWSADGASFIKLKEAENGQNRESIVIAKLFACYGFTSLKDINMQRFLLQATQAWMGNQPFCVHPDDEMYKKAINTYPLLRDERLFVLQEPAPLAPMFSSDSPASSSSDQGTALTSDRRSKKQCCIS